MDNIYLLTENNDKISVGNIYCIGRNYTKHIEELHSVNLGEPIVFSKYQTSIIQGDCEIKYPEFTNNLHHEIELVVIIGKKGKNILEKDAQQYIYGVAVGLDLTLRDVQNEAKKNGTPWLIAKAFDNSFPISKIYKINDLEILHNVEIYLEKNGSIVQQGNTKNMIFKIPYLVSYLSKFFTLNYGDIIMTGTPEGVGTINKNDILEYWSTFSEKVKVKIL